MQDRLSNQPGSGSDDPLSDVSVAVSAAQFGLQIQAESSEAS